MAATIFYSIDSVRTFCGNAQDRRVSSSAHPEISTRSLRSLPHLCPSHASHLSYQTVHHTLPVRPASNSLRNLNPTSVGRSWYSDFPAWRSGPTCKRVKDCLQHIDGSRHSLDRCEIRVVCYELVSRGQWSYHRLCLGQIHYIVFFSA